ncbi:hypothetical protein ACF1DV_37050 [Streptomyces achromogenes]|uniref:hypothetical protein n=1 Tax=Streptomyces achromogenes TaxID=67255 RepID=UPI0037004505
MSMPLTKLSHALVTSSAWAREPSVAWTMCAVAGSTTSREAEAKTSRSTSYGASAAFSGASRPARTASVEAYSPSATARREGDDVGGPFEQPVRQGHPGGRGDPVAQLPGCHLPLRQTGSHPVMPARRAGP